MKHTIIKFIRMALPLAIVLYFGLIFYVVIVQAQRPEPDLHDIDKRVSILESKEQDRRDNNTLLWTIIGGNVITVLLNVVVLAVQRKKAD